MSAVSTKHNFPDSLQRQNLICLLGAACAQPLAWRLMMSRFNDITVWFFVAGCGCQSSCALAALLLKGQHANAFHLFSTVMHNSVEFAIPPSAVWYWREEPPELKCVISLVFFSPFFVCFCLYCIFSCVAVYLNKSFARPLMRTSHMTTAFGI